MRTAPQPLAAQLATIARTPLADLRGRDNRAVVNRIVGKQPAKTVAPVAPLDVAAFNSAI